MTKKSNDSNSFGIVRIQETGSYYVTNENGIQIYLNGQLSKVDYKRTMALVTYCKELYIYYFMESMKMILDSIKIGNYNKIRLLNSSVFTKSQVKSLKKFGDCFYGVKTLDNSAVPRVTKRKQHFWIYCSDIPNTIINRITYFANKDYVKYSKFIYSAIYKELIKNPKFTINKSFVVELLIRIGKGGSPYYNIITPYIPHSITTKFYEKLMGYRKYSSITDPYTSPHIILAVNRIVMLLGDSDIKMLEGLGIMDGDIQSARLIRHYNGTIMLNLYIKKKRIIRAAKMNIQLQKEGKDRLLHRINELVYKHPFVWYDDTSIIESDFSNLEQVFPLLRPENRDRYDDYEVYQKALNRLSYEVRLKQVEYNCKFDPYEIANYIYQAGEHVKDNDFYATMNTEFFVKLKYQH